MSNCEGVELSLLHLKNPSYGKVSVKTNKAVTSLAAPHVESFNYFLGDGMRALIKNLAPIQFSTASGDKISVAIVDLAVGTPRLPQQKDEDISKLYPKECIERGCSYSAPVTVRISWKLNGYLQPPIDQDIGDIPIMVRSKNCNLYKMSPEELVKHGEIANETGGYFIINGTCRVLRLLTANRRNYPLAVNRDTWKKKNVNFTGKGIMMRCVRDDQTSVVNILHFLNTGMAKLSITVRRELFFIPLVMCLKILSPKMDHEIHEHLIWGREKDMYFSEKIKTMMRELIEQELYTQELCKNFVGKTFHHKLFEDIHKDATDEEACEVLFSKYVLIHLKPPEKFETLCLMARKLYSFVNGFCCEESLDSFSMHEVTLGGHTYLQSLKERLEEYLVSIRIQTFVKNRHIGESYKITEGEMRYFISHGKKLGVHFQTFLATGTLSTKTGCGLMQTTGLTVIMEHLNRMRDLSHLRAIHRGSVFGDLKTILPRRLTGEAWGFICPVHTPDGTPCGLLNHLTYRCQVMNHGPEDASQCLRALHELGMAPVNGIRTVPADQCLEVVLNGDFCGYISKEDLNDFVFKLRCMKVSGKIFRYTEIVPIPERKYGGQYPGLFLFTTVARVMRPVINVALGEVEYIGSFEQLMLNVAITAQDIEEGVHTHLEIEKTAIFSNIGKLVPFSDCNPNPRNMYQCQMGKQSMGMPFHNFQKQTTHKIYRLQYPQVPLIRNKHYDEVEMEEFSTGFNAVVAIVSYTGYDMEDAMVVNKASMERGLAHGHVYKSEFIDLTGNIKRVKHVVTSIFRRDPTNPGLAKFLDESGLPYPGTKLSAGDPYYCKHDLAKGTFHVTRYAGEDCIVDKYSVMDSLLSGVTECQRVNITVRVKRNPIIGDKFASRSGQKGILSRLYPVEDMPFSERGIIPDIIFNPHGIPSRMTAGKLIELIAGKAAAEFGKSFDSTPFEFTDENPAMDYFGKILEKAGFNYYGEDILYSGTDGRMMEVQLFEGIVYYQRLRHMTADKWQVRASGPVDIHTRQPIKGRSRGGAIRFGEMERDCLISHGAVYALKDRLLDCSDDSMEWVCSSCGGLLAPDVPRSKEVVNKYDREHPECVLCGPNAVVRQIHLPYAFKCMVAEFASIGIKTVFGIQAADSIIRQQANVIARLEE